MQLSLECFMGGDDALRILKDKVPGNKSAPEG